MQVIVKWNTVDCAPAGAVFSILMLPGASGSTKLMIVAPEVPTGIVNECVTVSGSWKPGGGSVSVTLHVDPDGPLTATKPPVAWTTPPPARVLE